MMSQQHSKNVYRRRRIVFGSVALAVVFGLIWSISGLVRVIAAPLPPLTITQTLPAEFVGEGSPLTPSVSGSIVYGSEHYAGPLISHGFNGQMPIASIAKVITSLVVLDEHPVDDPSGEPVITFTEKDEERYRQQYSENQSVVEVTAGMTLSLTDTVTVVLVASANNYSASLAEWAFGSVDAYVEAANRWLQENGLVDTTVVDASGLSELNVSTSEDLLQLARIAHDNDTVARVTALPSVDIPGVGTITNTNKLLGISGVTGLKTGTTKAAGACLLFTADVTVGDAVITTYGAIMGIADHDTLQAELVRFLAAAQNAFSIETLVAKGEQVGTASSEWGAETVLTASDDLVALTFGKSPVTIELAPGSANTGTAGTDAGDLMISDGALESAVNALFANDVPDAGFFWRMNHQESLGLRLNEDVGSISRSSSKHQEKNKA